MGQLLKRRLTDLWVVGRKVVLDDGQGPVTVWMQKNSPTEAAEINRRCDAQRARVLAARDDEDGDAWRSIVQAVSEYAVGKKEPIVEFLLTDERDKLRRTNEAKIAAEEEWSKDNYLQGLYDDWIDGGMEKRWLREPEDPEALAVKESLDRFRTEVNDAVDDEIELMRQAMTGNSQEELERRMQIKLLEMEGNQAWMQELYAYQLFFSVRDPDNKRERYFESREEIDHLSQQCFTTLFEAYQNLEVDVMEGKGSPAPTPSSPSSGERVEEGTATDSGLVGASQ